MSVRDSNSNIQISCKFIAKIFVNPAVLKSYPKSHDVLTSLSYKVSFYRDSELCSSSSYCKAAVDDRVVVVVAALSAAAAAAVAAALSATAAAATASASAVVIVSAAVVFSKENLLFVCLFLLPPCHNPGSFNLQCFFCLYCTFACLRQILKFGVFFPRRSNLAPRSPRPSRTSRPTSRSASAPSWTRR